ncbi:ferrochelatase, mitochondrial-like protein [Chytriomyces sp. MP71]|nr:ferrochelatase, mitochondrial-like protein [Chytriomyces sp. MP71]
MWVDKTRFGMQGRSKFVHTMLRGIAESSLRRGSTASTVSLMRSQFMATAPPPAAKKAPTALVLLNMGGPRTTADVHDFLFRLFSDKDLIPIPFQSILAPWITKRRVPKIQDQYAKIGGGSPIFHWTQRQGLLLEQLMDRIRPESAPHKHYIAFRYAEPLSEPTVEEMKRDGVKRAVALSLYPQYSCSTTGSSLNELVRVLKTADPSGSIQWSVIDRYPTQPLLVETFATHIKESLEKEYPASERDSVPILFSAHSLPMSVVNRGDTYPQEVAATVQAVMEKLNVPNPYRLCWQSQVGPSAWLGPKTEEVIKGYGKAGKKNLLFVPIAFVSDHIETLFELDLEYGHVAKEAGVTGYKRVESLNDDPLFIQCLGELVKGHLDAGAKHTPQLPLRCPMCVNEKCGKTKEYFGSQKLEW